MLPARRVLSDVLESDCGRLDPLVAAKEAFVSPADAQRWYAVSQISVPKTDTHCAGTLTIYLVGDPLAGILLCFDRGSYRECKRLRPDGTAQCVISGQRIGAVESMPPQASNPIDHAIAVTDKFFNSKDGGAS
jgi:hypothetical protein